MPNERNRHQLYTELKGVLSMDSADELMGYLPPVGWADVATKADLEMLRLEARADLADLKTDLQRWMVTTMLVLMSAQTAVIVAGVKLVH